MLIRLCMGAAMTTTSNPQQDIPPKVTTLAEQRGLGVLIDQRSNGNPFKGFLYGLIGGIIGLALTYGLFALAAYLWRPIMWAGIAALAFAICAIAWSFIQLARGFQAIYIYQGGVVYVRNGRARAATWDEVSEVEVQVIREGNLFAGAITAYVVKPTNQPPMRVASIDIGLPEGEKDPIGQLLIRLANEAGRPVTQRLVGKR